MTPYELTCIVLEPFRPALYRIVRKKLIKIAEFFPYLPEFLDVGGRRSPYTIGVPAKITITDLPIKTELQKKFGHGIDQEGIRKIYKRRSNISNVLFDDMSQSALESSSYDCVIAVEVLEHVKDYRVFIQHIHRILKPGGLFLMTTPNADHPKCVIGSSKIDFKYYTKAQLESLLNEYFTSTEIEYAVPVGKYFSWGHKSWSIRKPMETVLSMFGNFVNGFQAARGRVKYQPIGTRTLLAISKKKD